MDLKDHLSKEIPQQAATRQPRFPSARRIRGMGLWVVIPVGIAILGATGVGAYFAGYWIGSSREESSPSAEAAPAPPAAATTWTCSMHPQIKLPKPGKCPICFMDLIPLADDSDGDGHPRRLKMSVSAVALADIRTTPVKRQVVTRQVRMVGKVDYDETRLVDSTARIPGRLDRLYVDYTGVTVRQGDHLFSLYSPQLVVGQDELLLSLKAYREGAGRDPEQLLRNLRGAEEKLRLWGLLDEQIEQIKQQGKASDHLTIHAPVGGIVIRKHANEGAYVDTGSPVYTIADLSLVWVHLDAYESDVPWIRYGQEVEFTTQSFPGETFRGRVAFIDPVLNEKTRTVRVRVNVANKDLRLKPGMFVRAVVHSRLAAGGRVLDASLAGKWMCPMHPEIVKPEAGTCDLCEMDLVPAEELGFVASEEATEAPLVIPATAPLMTGKRAVVYVKVPHREQPTFEGREVLLADRAGDYYIVRDGLEEGEEVVTAGAFYIDAELQIQARPSMMSPPEETAGSVEKAPLEEEQ